MHIWIPVKQAVSLCQDATGELLESSLHLILALMTEKYTANYKPFSVRQYKSDVAPATDLCNGPHYLRSPRGRKNPGSLIRHMSQGSSGSWEGKWLLNGRTRTGFAAERSSGSSAERQSNRDGFSQETEQQQQVQAAGDLEAKLSSPSHPFWLFFVILGVPAKASHFNPVAHSSPGYLCSSCALLLPLPTLHTRSFLATREHTGEFASTYFENPCLEVFTLRGGRRWRVQ